MAAERKYRPEAWSTEFADHFNTSSAALRDIAPLLHRLAQSLGTPSAELKIYDPFYCDGSVKARFAAIGFRGVINRNRDFYRDEREGSLPPHQTVVTNPPYSADHKERALKFCIGCGRPWALLLPAYCATKQWFTDLASGAMAAAPFFLVPATRYAYDHPDGKGHDESPFFSIWIAGGFGDGVGDPARIEWANGVRLARTVADLEHLGAVPSQKRLSSKRRRKIRKQQMQRAASAATSSSGGAAGAPSPSGKLSAKERRRLHGRKGRGGGGGDGGVVSGENKKKKKKKKKKKQKKRKREAGPS